LFEDVVLADGFVDGVEMEFGMEEVAADLSGGEELDGDGGAEVEAFGAENFRNRVFGWRLTK
jgi:hypothetical protein